ncbi:MAG: sulfurtransferase [Pseudomonadales bacterium]
MRALPARERALYTTLISATDLAAAIATPHGVGANPVRLIDCRARLDDADFGARAYAAGHLPGAVFASLEQDFSAPPGAGGRHPLPPAERLAARLRDLGLNDHDQIVVYDDTAGSFAARAWWCLRFLGHQAVAVLDGGLAAWTGPLETSVPEPRTGHFSIRPSLTRTIDAQELLAGLDHADLVDARARPRFEGREEPIDPVAGHIPGASCLPFQGNLGQDGRFLSAAELQKRFHGHGADTVCYCGSGVTAAHNILAMRVAGLPEPRLYPGSWSEWIRDPSRPCAPARADHGQEPG